MNTKTLLMLMLMGGQSGTQSIMSNPLMLLLLMGGSMNTTTLLLLMLMGGLNPTNNTLPALTSNTGSSNMLPLLLLAGAGKKRTKTRTRVVYRNRYYSRRRS